MIRFFGVSGRNGFRECAGQGRKNKATKTIVDIRR